MNKPSTSKRVYVRKSNDLSTVNACVKNSTAVEKEIANILNQLTKAKSQTEHDIRFAKYALKFLELEWYELRDIVLKQSQTTSNVKQEVISENINPDDATGINSNTLNSLQLNFTDTSPSAFVASEEETEEEN